MCVFFRFDRSECGGVAPAIVLGSRIYDLSPVKIASFKSVDNDLCCCDICRERYVVRIAHTEQVILSFVKFALRCNGAEIEKNINLIVSDSGSDLLFSAVASGEEGFNFETACVGEDRCCLGCRAEMML